MDIEIPTKMMKILFCILQIGGNDQFGNISSGMEVIDKILKKRTFGTLTFTLIIPSQ